jgi:predicted nucleic acid-binding protein
MVCVFDSNIVIDYLNGLPEARREYTGYDTVYVSPITWVECQVKVPAGLEAATMDAIERDFVKLELSDECLKLSLHLRHTLRLKLPDAMILAGARVNGWTLVSRNTKDFPASMPGIRVPY